MATSIRVESDSMGKVDVPADKLWGSQTQRSLEHFSIGHDLMPREMIGAYAVLKRSAAAANRNGGRLDPHAYELITRVCDEILSGKHQEMFLLNVWMTGSGTQFNMNVNEVVSNRCCQIEGTPLGSKRPVHPNDHVNMSQSSNDSFPSAMNIAAAVGTPAFGFFATNKVLTYSRHIHAILPDDGRLAPDGMQRLSPRRVVERISPFLDS